MTDFFISYNRADKTWAEWIGWTLEDAGYSVVIDAWDFRPGGNFVLEMHRAVAESRKTIAVLSESYLKATYVHPEWAAAFGEDPLGAERKLIPVKVKDCQPQGLLKPLIYVDLIGLSKEAAREALLGAMVERAKPERVEFPGKDRPEAISSKPRKFSSPQAFPSALSRVQKIKEAALLQQLDSLSADLEALNQQLSFTTNAVDRNRLQGQRESIQQEMDKVATALDLLGA
jgi:hypothetical protein